MKVKCPKCKENVDGKINKKENKFSVNLKCTKCDWVYKKDDLEELPAEIQDMLPAERYEAQVILVKSVVVPIQGGIEFPNGVSVKDGQICLAGGQLGILKSVPSQGTDIQAEITMHDAFWAGLIGMYQDPTHYYCAIAMNRYSRTYMIIYRRDGQRWYKLRSRSIPKQEMPLYIRFSCSVYNQNFIVGKEEIRAEDGSLTKGKAGIYCHSGEAMFDKIKGG